MAEKMPIGVREHTDEGEWVTRVVNEPTGRRFLVTSVPVPGGVRETAVFESLSGMWFTADFHGHIRAANTDTEQMTLRVHDCFAEEFRTKDPESLVRAYKPGPCYSETGRLDDFDELPAIRRLREKTNGWVKETASTYDDLARDLQEVMETDMMFAAFDE